jgi:hypothetical protein
MYFVLPALRISSRAGIDCSIGVSFCSLSVAWSKEKVAVHTRIDTVEIVEIRRKAQSLDRAVDVRLDVLRRVGHGSVFEGRETAFGCDYTQGND